VSIVAEPETDNENVVNQSKATANRDFTSQRCGQITGIAFGVAVPGGPRATINGSDQWQNCVCGGSSSAALYAWWVEQGGVFYQNRIVIDARGPSGAFNNIRFIFTDETGDTYTLRVWDTSRKQHYVDYNSSAPPIISIAWDAT
jgi:hypothetical protein